MEALAEKGGEHHEVVVVNPNVICEEKKEREHHEEAGPGANTVRSMEICVKGPFGLLGAVQDKERIRPPKPCAYRHI